MTGNKDWSLCTGIEPDHPAVILENSLFYCLLALNIYEVLLVVDLNKSCFYVLLRGMSYYRLVSLFNKPDIFS